MLVSRNWKCVLSGSMQCPDIEIVMSRHLRSNVVTLHLLSDKLKLMLRHWNFDVATLPKCPSCITTML